MTEVNTNDADTADTGTDTGADAGADTNDTTILGGASDEAGADDGDKGADANADADKAEGKGADGEDKSGEGGEEEFSLTGAPEGDYDLESAMPEGVTVDKALLEAASPVLKELDISNEAAAKLTAAIAPVIAQGAEKATEEAGATLRAEMAKETMADKEVGGANHEKAKAMSAKAMAKFMPSGKEGQKFRTFLNESGLGNHVEMVRFMARVGAALGEATADQGGGTGQSGDDKASRWYGNNG